MAQMRSKTVTLAWIAGLALAALVYAVGPDDALEAVFRFSDAAGLALQRLVETLGGRAFEVLRALAIGCFAVFFVLSIVAAGRGLPGIGLLLLVSVLFLLLVWHEGPQATGHWLLAFILAAAAALNMTRKLGDVAATPPTPGWTPPPR